jgi:two-component system, NtrC family, sensor kinase
VKPHPLIERQLRNHFGSAEKVPEALHAFITTVSNAYADSDRDRKIIEHALEEMSAELTERNRDLRKELNEHKEMEIALQREKAEQEALIQKLAAAQEQLLQSEKLASIGQLAAGVAHEINNPIGYVSANITSLEKYVNELLLLLDAFDKHTSVLPSDHEAVKAIANEKKARDLEFLKEDIPSLLHESKEGLSRVRKIVQELREFSRSDEGGFVFADLHQGLESTLKIVNNEVKYTAEVIRDYGELPKVECNLSQINQVFMNLLVNAAHAIADRGSITIKTGTNAAESSVWVEIKDTGCGISPENFKRIFDPFFTTKPVGKGTGLGLSLSYGIIQRHHGRIDLESVLGAGTTFKITLPVRQPVNPEGAQQSVGSTT